jgi:hypothetical protein
MRRQLLCVVAAAALAACADGGTEPLEVESALLVDAAGGHGAHGHFKAHATGREEVPANASRAQGQAIFRLSRDGTELYYKLIVANITNVSMAHIHLAPAGVNGPVVVWLYPSGPPPVLIPGRTQGVLAEGTITAANLVGPLAGATLEALLAHIREGNAYVNVHTSQFPGGEVRGQID